jgi:hypothetical protein
LVDCCGDEQPWVVMPTVRLEQVRQGTRFELLLLDVEIPEEFRRRAGEALPQPGHPTPGT